MNDLVSVVVPVYNGETLLAATLESVLAQTYAPLEVIAVDDGSVDGSADVIRRYPEVALLQQANAGVAAARNAGAARAAGHYLAFADQDDLWSPARVAVQVRASRASGRGFVTCHLRYVLQGPAPAWFRGPVDGTSVPGFVPSTWLVTRETFDRVGGFDPRFGHGCDTDWIARARSLAIEPLVLPDHLVDYRVHAANASGDPESLGALTAVLRSHVQRKREAGP